MLQSTLSNVSTNLLDNFNVIVTSIEKYLDIYNFDINQLVLDAYKKKKDMN